MEQILIYADSLSWGIIPETRQRLTFDKRWPGIFENSLLQIGRSVRVIENCLNGRRTVWSDPFKDGRDGSQGLSQVIEMHAPLKLIILMLGSNDFQDTHENNAWLSAQGMARLVDDIRKAPIEPGMPIADILIVVPPVINQAKGSIAHKFKGAERRCAGLAEELASVARQLQTFYFDANKVTEASKVDGIHLDESQHRILGQAIADYITQQNII